MGNLEQEILQKHIGHGNNLDGYFNVVIKAMQAFHEAKLKEELIKFSQQFYADEETCIHNVNEYLKQRNNE